MTRIVWAGLLLPLLLLAGCAGTKPVLVFQRDYARQQIPASLTDPVPHPQPPPAPVTESGALARDAAYGEALDQCNFQKLEIRRMVDNGGLPTEDMRAK